MNTTHDCQAPPGEGQVRVLIVHDDEETAKQLAGAIRRWGHRAWTSFPGYCAHSLAKELCPHVIVLEMGASTQFGLAFARAIKNDRTLHACAIVALDNRHEGAGALDPHILELQPERLREFLSKLRSSIAPRLFQQPAFQ